MNKAKENKHKRGIRLQHARESRDVGVWQSTTIFFTEKWKFKGAPLELKLYRNTNYLAHLLSSLNIFLLENWIQSRFCRPNHIHPV